MRLLYITGTGRSGSTILAAALGGLGNVTNLGELNFFWSRGVIGDQLCGCGKSFTTCPFWQSIVARGDALERARYVERRQRHFNQARYAFPQLIPGIRAIAVDGLGRDREWREYIADLEFLYGAISDELGPDAIVVDSSKSIPYLLNLRRVRGIDITAIHLVRDSRSVAMSWKRRKLQPEVTDTRSEMQRMSPRASAINWNIANGMAGALAGISDLRYTQLRLEDFVARPEREFTRLVSELGLSTDSVPGRFVDPTTLTGVIAHTVSGNPARFAVGDVALHRDDDWCSQLTDSELRIIRTLTLPLLRRYGYI